MAKGLLKNFLRHLTERRLSHQTDRSFTLADDPYHLFDDSQSSFDQIGQRRIVQILRFEGYHATDCRKVSPITLIQQYRFATPKSLQTRQGLAGCRTGPFLQSVARSVV